MAVMTIIISPLSGRLVGRRGPRLPLVLSSLGTIAASVMLTGIGAHTPMLLLLGGYAIFGVGFGFVNAPITNAAVSGMPREQAGVASAVATTSRQFGQTLGVAIIGAIIASHHSTGLTSASHPASWTLTTRRDRVGPRAPGHLRSRKDLRSAHRRRSQPRGARCGGDHPMSQKRAAYRSCGCGGVVD
jgi:hypothetical protein